MLMRMWNLRKEECLDLNSNVLCNLFKVCKQMNAEDLKTGLRQTTMEAICKHMGITYPVAINTLITHSGDWGVQKTESGDISQSAYSHNIQDATRGGAFLNLEIESIVSSAKKWYMTNMREWLHEKIYPVPIGLLDQEMQVDKLRSIQKDKLCYANFTITSPYRIRVAEWAWSQRSYIDCNFPKRYETQDIELEMTILNGVKLERAKFLETLASYNFAIAPTGNGLDTFRTWECVLCNTVPIVQDNWMNRVFSQIWPMIIVSRYEFSKLPMLINTFFEKHGAIEYDHSLLREENLETLLDRIRYESDRLRRKRV
jgi:hypothetical protein